LKRYFLMLFRRLKYSVVFFLLVTGFLIVVLWDRIVYITPVGHSSVEWYSILGGSRISRGPLREGVHVIWPWNKFYTYDLRLQNRKESYAVVSQDGLHFDMDLNFRWHVLKEAVVTLNQEIGPEYIDRLLIPEIGSVLRHVVASFTAESIYTTERNRVQQLVFDELTSRSHPNGIRSPTNGEDGIDTILLSDILITRIDLPENIQQAIERKLSEAELVKEYAFRVERETLESQRKAVEAEGIRLFQETVAPAITDSYLAWRGIEATLELAKSNNAKVIVIGNSSTGLPLILDTGGEVLTSSP
jgi:prohibitin 1